MSIHSWQSRSVPKSLSAFGIGSIEFRRASPNGPIEVIASSSLSGQSNADLVDVVDCSMWAVVRGLLHLAELAAAKERQS